MEPPCGDQRTGSRIEQVLAAQRRGLCVSEQLRHFVVDVGGLAGGNGRIDARQFRRLPGVQQAMQAVEFAQYLAQRITRLRAVDAVDDDFDPGTEHEGFLPLHRLARAAGEQPAQPQQRNESASALPHVRARRRTSQRHRSRSVR